MELTKENYIEVASLKQYKYCKYFEQIGSSYRPCTLFVSLFVVAQFSGKESTEQKAREYWDTYSKEDVRYKNIPILAELIESLRFLSWESYGENDQNWCEIFSNLYYEFKDEFYKIFTSESEEDKNAREYFFNLDD